MRILTKSDLGNIILGSTLMGTGGGGDPRMGKRLIKKIEKINLVGLDELKDNDYVFSVFMVGSSGIKENSTKGLQLAKEFFFKRFKFDFKAVVPVELGGGSLGNCLYMASGLNLPVLDGDIVGYRASPEVFLETITLKNLKRTPLVVANNKGDVGCLENSDDYVFIENFLRGFAADSGGIAYVCGYPLKIKDIKGLIGNGSLTFCQKLGRLMKKGKYYDMIDQFNFSVLGDGVVSEVSINNIDGFLKGSYTIKNSNNEFTVKIKNENIVCAKNGKTILTTPDLILAYDLENNEGVYNRDLKKGMKVSILACKAIPIWRTESGIKLFSPKNLGFDEGVKLKEDINSENNK